MFYSCVCLCVSDCCCVFAVCLCLVVVCYLCFRFGWDLAVGWVLGGFCCVLVMRFGMGLFVVVCLFRCCELFVLPLWVMVITRLL